MRAPRILALLAIVAAVLSAGSRKRIWTLDLSRFVARPELAELVWGVAFSPDETKIAIGFGPNLNLDTQPRRVIIVAIDQPKVVFKEFDAAGRGVISGSTIEWSPSGDMLAVKSNPPVMFRLNGERSCSFSDNWSFAGFLSRDRMVISTAGSIRILNADCSESTHRAIADSARAVATSSKRDLIAMESSDHAEFLDGALVTRLPLTGSLGIDAGSIIFPALPDRVCSASELPDQKSPFAACWDTRTGELATQDPKLGVDRLGMQSSGGNLVALTQYRWIFHDGPVWTFFDMNNDYAVPRRHVLWNVETGREFASWGELHQTELLGKTRDNARAVKSPFVLSLSRTARYFAEGGSGIVTLYSLVP